MQFLIILVFTLATALALPSKEIRSRNLIVPAGRPQGRITNGKNANSAQFPYQVSLLLYDEEEYQYWCGGSILSNEWILTAAHCTEGAAKAEVLLGSIDRTSGKVIHKVNAKDFVIHEHWNNKTLENDIALIKIPFTKYSSYITNVTLPAIKNKTSPDIKPAVKTVNKSVKLPGIGNYIPAINPVQLPSLRPVKLPLIKPAKLPVIGNIISSIKPEELPAKDNSYEDYVGQNVTATGWGRTSDDPNSRASTLQWATLQIITNDKCEYNEIHSSNICTKTVKSVNICDGDSGGPLVLTSEKIQIGIVSFGYSKCLKNFPGVHTRVTNYLEWIKNKTNIFY